MGSYHSVTPCASSEGTIIKMSRMNRVLRIDRKNMTITAQAGLQIIDAAKALRAEGLQLITNVEIGNATLGSAACCYIKDGLDCGLMCSSATSIKWVTPSGDLAEASESTDPDLLHFVRSSHGLCGVVYEVTFRVKPVEHIKFTYLPRPISQLTQKEVNDVVAGSEGLMCWTVGDTSVFQVRRRALKPSWLRLANVRRHLWTQTAPLVARMIDQYVPTESLRSFSRHLYFATYRATYATLHGVGGYTLDNPDKIVDYGRTPPSSRFSFSFWAFPVARWLEIFLEYRKFADEHHEKNGFRCNCPLVSYHLPKDTRSILSCTSDGGVLTIDPIHAFSNQPAWERFLHEFNEFCYERKGIPLLNQTPFVEKKHFLGAYGERWRAFSDWARKVDPEQRMLNGFFAELLV
jgi:FAD/FMN-containing dehydrogenase